MSFRAMLAADAERVFANPAEWGEAVALAAPALPDPVSVTAVWGPVEKDAERRGLVADWCDVDVPTAQVAAYGAAWNVRRGDAATLTRNPDEPAASEEWKIGTVRDGGDGMTRFEVFTLARPAGRPR